MGDTALECWDLGQGQKLGDSDKVAPLSKHLQSLTSWAIFFGKVSHDQVEVGQFLALPLETPMEELGNLPLPLCGHGSLSSLGADLGQVQSTHLMYSFPE